MNNETWKDIEGYEDLYTISDHGQIKRKSRELLIDGVTRRLDEKVLKNFKGTLGYMHVNLYKNGKPKQFKIHRLMMTAFVDKPIDKNIINHIDGDKSNNLLKNLEWCSHKENSIHAYNTGLAKGGKGEENSQSRLTEKDVLNIRELYATGTFTQKELGLKFNISREQARDIINYKRWKHI
ncbi:NUMOD4 domain-containing protein [Staphylococcus shinii]|uniref:NUMOD4 domain-containing protein n=1 Tax=Staphylococcus shinii TaxID=2912228 RepID=UPI00068D987C|nr:NUMOD4 domain-containing protein [Staphylococcus shinii]